MASPQASLLSDGRLHLHHGPIDLIIGVTGECRKSCYDVATERFQTILERLVDELPALRRPLEARSRLSGSVARRMVQAVRPFSDIFVTPMAAVAGSVADEILVSMVSEHQPQKAYVNNGGDIALHLTGEEEFSVLSPAGRITVRASDAVRGIATSGWRGRSHSLGIADAVTVLANNAAAADVAATLIANAVDLPGHPDIKREPASELNPESDLGERLVTTDVGTLSQSNIEIALVKGDAFAQRLIATGDIHAAVLMLHQRARVAGSHAGISSKGLLAHA